MAQCGSRAFLFTNAIPFVSIIFGELKFVDRVFQLLVFLLYHPETEKTYTYLYGYYVYTQLQNIHPSLPMLTNAPKLLPDHNGTVSINGRIFSILIVPMVFICHLAVVHVSLTIHLPCI